MQPMWADATRRAALLAGAAAGQPAEVRKEAFWALANLTYDAANRHPMWADAATHRALLAGAAADQPASVREHALWALTNLATDAANRHPMWADAVTRTALLAGAAANQPASVREHALYALGILSRDDALRPRLVADGVRELLEAGADADGLPDITRSFLRARLVDLVGVQPPPPPVPVATVDDLLCRLDTTPVTQWGTIPGAGASGADAEAQALYMRYLCAHRYDGTYTNLTRLVDRLDFMGLNASWKSGAAARATLASSGRVPILVPPGVPTRVLLVLACDPRPPRGMIHAGIVLQMEQEHDNYKAVNRVCQAIGEQPLEPLVLLHLIDDGQKQGTPEVEVECGSDLAALQAVVSAPLGGASACLDITHSAPTTDAWVEPLFQVVAQEEAKQLDMNVKSTLEQTNCTVFVLSALRRLGAGGVVDLSGEAVKKHLMAEPQGVPGPQATAISEAWRSHWAQFVSVPTYHGQGIAKDLKPMMHKLIGVFAQRMQGGGAGPSNGAAARGHKGVKRMRGD